MIPYGRQSISEADIEAVINVLKSDFLTQGPAVPAFEKALQDFSKVKHAIAVNSATSGLHLACLALGVGSGDVVWTSSITFVASANCALYCCATVDFVDIDSQTYNLCVDRLTEKLIEADRSNKLPKVVIAVHLAGQSCNMRAIHELSKKYGFKIIEDASHAIGGSYENHPVGDCRYSDITVFSFHPVKIITTGEGGAVLTNNSALAKKMISLRSHGITRDESEMTHASDGNWYYQQIDLGYNYRMTDMQAALGFSQIQRIEQFVKARHDLASRYNKQLADLPLTLPYQIESSYSAFHLYIIRLQLKKINKTHREVFDALRNAGIGVNLHYIPVHTQPYYRNLKSDHHLPESEKYYQEAISLPIFSQMDYGQQDKVISALKGILI
jgi:UDP-4-amino-4,6-dideoxy-N-acetyl-beta-L-altrosamine transaminase